MSRINFIYLVLKFFDFFQQKKIFNFLKKRLSKNSILFDVGAHNGETIFNFTREFNYSQIHSFEPSEINFKILVKRISSKTIRNLFINNYGFSDKKKKLLINQSIDTASSTLSKINSFSKYYKKKIKILGIKNEDKYTNLLEVKLIQLDEYNLKKGIKRIDLLKIDTEGHEYYVLKGASKSLKKIRYIYFEHHYDDMLIKGYKFSDIHYFLKSHNFILILKSKMYFRKTFEYIYENLNFK